MGIRELRSMTGLSQQEFAEMFHIPKRTIENWESTGPAHREPPKYLLELIEYKIKTENNLK